MEKLTANQVRTLWIEFWKSKDHAILPSASLVPKNDPSLLWINSGVATLKDYFSGEKIPDNRKMANSQKCIRTNDIENVGQTSRHHTLFEMLGNFSIGDYFKDKALEWALEFLFDVLKLEQKKIYITYYENDDYTYKKWQALGIDSTHLIKGTRETNFWDLGAGPCGPDTEIFYDRGAKYDPQKKGIELLEKDLENDRYIEIWNIVFSQFNNDGENNYTDLKNKNIDTGAGLERIISIFQDAPTNFDTDLFLPLIKATEKMALYKYEINNYFVKEKHQAQVNKHFRIIADHMRAVTHAINDGARPSSTQRGYIIRKLIRRAYYSGLQLGIKDRSFLYKLVKVVKQVLPIYELFDIEMIIKIIKREELSFAKVIEQGTIILNKMLSKKSQINAKMAFKLFETYGLPLELIKNLLEQRGIVIKTKEFEALKEKHAKDSQGKQVVAMKSKVKAIDQANSKVSEFVGYDTLRSESKVIQYLKENNKHYVLLDKTPFYATKGGQLYDKGTINGHQVTDVFSDAHSNHWHVLKTWDNVTIVVSQVDPKIRNAKACNHSGTHILGHALRQVVSNDIIQLGSENNEHKLRFDFPLAYKIDKETIKKVEKVANEMIANKIPRQYIIDTFKNGLKMGALAIDNEIEGDPEQICRIVKFGDSIEFCGGTHVNNTSVIERLKIIKLETKGSGIYRMEAITSSQAINNFETNQKFSILKMIESVVAKNQFLESYYQKFKTTIGNQKISELNDFLFNIKQKIKNFNKETKNIVIDFNVKFQIFEGMETFIKLDVEPIKVKKIALKLRELYPGQLFIIGAQRGHYLIAVASSKYNCHNVFTNLKIKYDGKGGGNKNFAMGTLKDFKIKA